MMSEIIGHSAVCSIVCSDNHNNSMEALHYCARKISLMRKYGHIYFSHDDVIIWKHFLRYWPFVRGIHLPPVDCPHKGQWRGALMFSLICAWTKVWAKNRDAGNLKRHHAHHGVTVMSYYFWRENFFYIHFQRIHDNRLIIRWYNEQTFIFFTLIPEICKWPPLTNTD